MAEFNGAASFPFPTASGVINGVNGEASFPFPVAAGALLLAISFDGAASFPFPEVFGRLNQYFDGAGSFPFPTCQGDLILGTAFDGAAEFPFPTAHGTMDAVWVGAADFPFPTASGLLAASIPQMEGAASFPFPVAVGILAGASPNTFTVLVMNLKNKVVSIYENYNFNSACKLNGVYLGAASDGIHILTGSDDNGDPINASITMGDSDFGLPANIKMIPELFIDYSGDGLEVFVARDQTAEMGAAENTESGPYPVPATADGKTQTKRAKLPGGFRGGNWQFRVANVDGGAFNIQSIGLPVEKSQRRLN